MRMSALLAGACLWAGLWLGWSCPPAQAAGQPQLALAKASLGAATLELELAVSPRERYSGLSGREGLNPGRGMAFVFPTPGRWGMVMRGMSFGLDFVWLRDSRVVAITPRVPPPRHGQAPREVEPPQDIDTVIELPAGYAQAQGLAVGQRLVWRK